ncbi:hypothetical protein B0H12DRAFT_1091568 [Mycena haematopus]|nr:hypothetical protein B0H12DRAFT_1091568 [Mycena haematopus]
MCLLRQKPLVDESGSFVQCRHSRIRFQENDCGRPHAPAEKPTSRTDVYPLSWAHTGQISLGSPYLQPHRTSTGSTSAESRRGDSSHGSSQSGIGIPPYQFLRQHANPRAFGNDIYSKARCTGIPREAHARSRRRSHSSKRKCHQETQT